MVKFILKETGKEVKVGDILTVCLNSPFGELSAEVTVTAGMLEKLIEHNLAITESSMDITFPNIIAHLAKRIGWKEDNVEKYLDNLYEMSPRAVFNVILMEIALILDEKYEGHISGSENFYVLAYNKDGNIVVTKYPTFISNIPTFRNTDDAEAALAVMKVLVPEVCHNGKQED